MMSEFGSTVRAVGGLLPGQDLRDVGLGAGVEGPIDPRSGGDGVGAGDIAGGAAVALTLARLGMVLHLPPAVIAGISALGGGAAVLTWDSMPGWLQGLMLAAGAVAGASLIIKGVQALGGNGAGPAAQMGSLPAGSTFVSSWVANGTTFYRLADGRLSVQNKRGVWKTWRPRRGTLVFSNGSSSLQGFLKADKALNKQSKRIEKVLNRRTRPRTKPRSK